MSGFSTVSILKGNFESQGPYILLNKNQNFNKNGKESKKENPTPIFSETNLVFQLMQESQMKRKTVTRWSSRKKKRAFFAPFILSEENFVNICVLCQCLVY